MRRVQLIDSKTRQLLGTLELAEGVTTRDVHRLLMRVELTIAPEDAAAAEQKPAAAQRREKVSA